METTTTNTNVQLIQQAFNDFLQGNIQAILNACDDQVEWSSYKNSDVPFSGTFYGKEGVQEFFAAIAENIDYQQFEPKEYVTQGDTVIVLGHHAGTAKKTGRTFDHDWCMHFKLRNEKVAYYFIFVDTLEQAKCFKE